MKTLITLLASLSIAACAGAPAPTGAAPTAASTGTLSGSFGPETVGNAVALLARAGVPVRVRPGEEPMTAVTGSSRIALLRFQVRNLALEANQGGGTSAADLDALGAANGGVSISDLVRGWAQSGGTEAGQAAADLLGGDRIPSLVLALLLADLTAGGSVAAPVQQTPTDDFCADVAAYLAAALEGVLDPQATFEPAWLQQVIDRSAGALEPDPAKLRNAVAAMALLVYATSISRPWSLTLVASPSDVHYIVGEDELTSPVKEFRLAVETGAGSFAEEIDACAELAGIELIEREVEGAGIYWQLPGLTPHTSSVESDLELDENGQALLEYQTKSETKEAHDKGTEQSAVGEVLVTVLREEIADVQAVVERLLTGGQLGVEAPTVTAVYERLGPILGELLLPNATAEVEVTWHGGPEPTPSPAPSASVDPSGGGGGSGGSGSGLGEDTGHCGSGCAGSHADPHLMTVDGIAYDLQSAGEFVLLRSADGAVEIQSRQVPIAGSSDVSINTAVAARVNGRRLTAYTSGGKLEARLDGESIDVSIDQDLGSGARIVPRGDGVEILFPDGTALWVLPSLAWTDVAISPSEDLRAEGRGVLGPVPAGSRLPLLPDGSALPAQSDRLAAFEQIHGPFADAWRVTADTSLFDYASGESPTTFVVPGFPRTPAEPSPEQLAAGESACVSVTDTTLHGWCVFDAAVTGIPDFGPAYAQMTRFYEEGPESLGTEAVALPPGTHQALPSVLRVFGSALGPDGTLYVSVEETAGVYAVVALGPSKRHVVARAEAAYGGEVRFSAGSVWAEDFSRRATVFDCSLGRLDPTSLSLLATIDIPCDLSHTWTATADAAWVIDETDLGPDRAGNLRRIDPATNAPDDTRVALPFSVGLLTASETTLFYIDQNINEQRGAFRSVPGAAEVERIGPSSLAPLGEFVPRAFPMGEGLWIPAKADSVFYKEIGASFYTAAGDPDRTVSYDGRLVGVDPSSLFIFRRESDQEVLYRYPVDGGEPVRLNSGAQIPTANGSTYIGYGSSYGALALLVGRDRVVQPWLVPLDAATMSLWIQDTPLP